MRNINLLKKNFRKKQGKYSQTIVSEIDKIEKLDVIEKGTKSTVIEAIHPDYPQVQSSEFY